MNLYAARFSAAGRRPPPGAGAHRGGQNGADGGGVLIWGSARLLLRAPNGAGCRAGCRAPGAKGGGKGSVLMIQGRRRGSGGARRGVPPARRGAPPRCAAPRVARRPSFAPAGPRCGRAGAGYSCQWALCRGRPWGGGGRAAWAQHRLSSRGCGRGRPRRRRRRRKECRGRGAGTERAGGPAGRRDAQGARRQARQRAGGALARRGPHRCSRRRRVAGVLRLRRLQHCSRWGAREGRMAAGRGAACTDRCSRHAGGSVQCPARPHPCPRPSRQPSTSHGPHPRTQMQRRRRAAPLPAF
jgi:hypothetical protein